jgi:general secretion pathway protein E
MSASAPSSGVSIRSVASRRPSEIGGALVEASEISQADWKLATEVARQNGSTEIRAMLDLGYIGEDPLARALARLLGVERWRADAEGWAPDDAFPGEFMRANDVLVLVDPERPETPARVVLADPTNQFVLGSLIQRLGDRPVTVAMGTHKDIDAFLADREASAPGAGEEAEDAGGGLDVSGELSTLRELASEAPVIRFFNQVVERAMELGASDIHLERFDRRVSLRVRVDGVLVEHPAPQPRMYEPLLCRIKILSNLDIAERRRAQDGRIQLRLRGRNIDMRVSIIPTMYGQDAAIRLQDRQRLADIDLTDLGFERGAVERLVSAASLSHGILLITGPTGSGKTTTLYALLRRLASIERKVITVEDPVEYAMDGINQIQANAEIGLTFSTTLRNILRHDPDVILVGEIRDRETAEMAFQSALTGHMVLSTLHTNDVPSSFVRLIDMGVEPYLVNAAVVGVSAQRLLRKVYRPDASGDDREADRVAADLGYKGRVAVMEFVEPYAELKRLVLQGADEHRLRESLLRTGFLPMRADAQRLIDEGVTDEAEVARVLGHAPTTDIDGLPDTPHGTPVTHGAAAGP